MNRALYFLGGVAVMALISLAQGVDLVRPRHASSIAATAAAPRSAPSQDPATSAADDLAAWPVATSR